MSRPKTIKAGFKTPPLDALKGRGPPRHQKRPFFSPFLFTSLGSPAQKFHP